MADATGLPEPVQTTWKNYLTHVQHCATCRSGPLCAEGVPLKDAHQAALRAWKTPDPRPDERSGWCAWHGGYSQTTRVIEWQDSGSGPQGFTRSACRCCRGRHRLVPLAEQPSIREVPAARSLTRAS